MQILLTPTPNITTDFILNHMKNLLPKDIRKPGKIILQVFHNININRDDKKRKQQFCKKSHGFLVKNVITFNCYCIKFN